MPRQINLLTGEPEPEPQPAELTSGGNVKRPNTKPNGYAAPPGGGPDGETCGSCAHSGWRHASRRYFKCGLMRRAWTNGRGSDILVRSPACALWKAPDA